MIHSTGWVPRTVPVATRGVLKVLGNRYDISTECIHDSQYQYTKKQAEKACNILSRTRGDPAHKRMVLRCCVSKRAEYNGQFSAWSPQQMEDLDKVFSKIYRTLSSNHYAYPTELLYLPVDMGGLGYHRTSDGISTAKYSMLQRHLNIGGHTESNMDTLLYSYTLQTNQPHLPGEGTVVQAGISGRHSTWADSLIRFANEGGFCISSQEILRPKGMDPLIRDATQISQATQEWLQDCGVSREGDLHTVSEHGVAAWMDLKHTKAESLTQCIEGLPPKDPVTLRPAQQWIPSSDSAFSDRIVVEILGWSEQDAQEVHFRTFSTNNGDPVRGTSILDKSRDQLYGGSSLLGGSAQDFLGQYPRRVFSSSIKGSLGRTVNLVAKPTIYDLSTVRDERVWLPQDMIDKLTDLSPFIIFSDGAWMRIGSPWRHVFGTSPEFEGSVGLIFMSALENWRDLPIYSFALVNGQRIGSTSAFSMELFGLLVALNILGLIRIPSTIYSDCEAAVKSVNNLDRGSKRIRATTRDASMLSAAVNLLRDQDTVISWTKGHPERVDKDADNWTKEMWGNLL